MDEASEWKKNDPLNSSFKERTKIFQSLKTLPFTSKIGKKSISHALKRKFVGEPDILLNKKPVTTGKKLRDAKVYSSMARDGTWTVVDGSRKSPQTSKQCGPDMDQI